MTQIPPIELEQEEAEALVDACALVTELYDGQILAAAIDLRGDRWRTAFAGASFKVGQALLALVDDGEERRALLLRLGAAFAELDQVKAAQDDDDRRAA